MKNTITNSAKIVVSLSVVLGMVTMAGAASVVGGGSGATTTAGGTTTSTTTYTDPCAGSSGSGSTWTAPGSTAPAGNVAAPVNVSGTAQWKPGKLTLGSVPCPMPLTGWTPGSALTVNGITDTTGFSNWGSTFLKGVTAIGTNPTMFTSASGTPQPMLYVQGPDADAAPAGYRFARAAALFDGQVVVKGPYGSDPTTTKHWLYVGGYPVCNQNGAGCPTATATTTTTTSSPNYWNLSGTQITNNNTGDVNIVGTGLYVGTTTRLGRSIDYGGTTVVSVAPGTVNFDAPGVPGGRMSIDGSTGNVTIGTNLKVANTLRTSQLWVGDPIGQPAVLFTTGDGHAVWKPVKKIRYGCQGHASEIRDGRILVMDTADFPCEHGPDIGGGLGTYAYAIVP